MRNGARSQHHVPSGTGARHLDHMCGGIEVGRRDRRRSEIRTAFRGRRGNTAPSGRPGITVGPELEELLAANGRYVMSSMLRAPLGSGEVPRGRSRAGRTAKSRTPVPSGRRRRPPCPDRRSRAVVLLLPCEDCPSRAVLPAVRLTSRCSRGGRRIVKAPSCPRCRRCLVPTTPGPPT